MWWLRRKDQSHHKRMQQITTKRLEDKTQLEGEGDPLEIVQEA